MKQVLITLAFAAGVALLFQLTPASAGEWPSSCGNNKTHNFLFGMKSYYDRLLYTQRVHKSSSFLTKLSFDEQVPPKGTYFRGVITAVEVQDQYHNGNGGCAYLKSGGPGYANVTLHFKSQRNKAVDFIVNLYGR